MRFDHDKRFYGRHDQIYKQDNLLGKKPEVYCEEVTLSLWTTDHDVEGDLVLLKKILVMMRDSREEELVSLLF
jgi:hypothetical protein